MSMEWKRVGVMDGDSADDETVGSRWVAWEDFKVEWLDEDDAIKQEVDSKDRVMHNDTSDLWF